MATWLDVNKKFESELGISGSEKSDFKSLTRLAKKAERVGISPDMFFGTKINNLRAIVRPLRDAAVDDDVQKMTALLTDAQSTNMTDLRLKLGKKVETVPVTQMGDVVVAMFSKTQFEKLTHRNRAYLKFATA
jgi:hypothetical protein